MLNLRIKGLAAEYCGVKSHVRRRNSGFLIKKLRADMLIWRFGKHAGGAWNSLSKGNLASLTGVGAAEIAGVAWKRNLGVREWKSKGTGRNLGELLELN